MSLVASLHHRRAVLVEIEAVRVSSQMVRESEITFCAGHLWATVSSNKDQVRYFFCCRNKKEDRLISMYKACNKQVVSLKTQAFQ
jgi:hypothetical protein